ncbi:S41 family peptidase [Marinimicrobium alkaliphilum]|uniref:S41 family peptidase n=1 Tax=Marinimicrobium alkaliphilum TaxID=2202654 RepID=UPI000DBAB6B9|nr:S41 family peptidase [Marinimicrobium alkaliphilum]
MGVIGGRSWRRLVVVLVLGFWGHGLGAVESGEVELPRFPSISPDGSELVFSWRGDLWLSSAEGGDARRLTRHNLDDLYSSWSPDGQWIVFSSMRDGHLNLWRIRRDGTGLTQLTFGDRFIRHPDYARDRNGEPVLTFSSSMEADVYREQRPYLMAPDGGPYTRLHDAFGAGPRLSPDGERIVFTRGGAYHNWSRRHYRGPDNMEVWLYDRAGEAFTQITSWEGDDGNAQWLDEQTLVFMSDRALDTVNLYRADLGAADGEGEPPITRLTHFEGRDIQHFDVARNGSRVVLHVWDQLYTLDLRDPEAEPVPLALKAGMDGQDDYALRRIDREVTEAALSPDGRVMAYIAYGRVYMRHMDDHSPTRAVTPGTHARHKDLAWSPDGLYLYFVNDEDTTWSIYRAEVALTREDIRQGAERVIEELPEPASEEPGGGPLRLDDLPLVVPEPASAARVPDELAPDLQASVQEDPFGPVDPGMPFDPRLQLTLPEPLDPLLVDPLLPDVPEPVPDPMPEQPVADVPEGTPTRLDPNRWHDAVQFQVQPVVQTGDNDRGVSPSPDGRSLAFRRGLGDLMILDTASGDVRTLVSGWDFSLHWRWSPDSRHIAYSQNDMDYSANIFVVPADGSAAPVNITRHPRNDINPRWSADSRILTFASNRSGDSYDIYRVYLDPSLENFNQRELAHYYRDARQAAANRRPLAVGDSGAQSEPPSLDLDGAWRRVTRMTSVPPHQYDNEMTPSGDRYLFNSAGQGLVVMNWDGSGRRVLGPLANVQQMTLRGDRLVTIANGQVLVRNLAGQPDQSPAISDQIRIDLRQQSRQKFREAARMIGESFYHPTMKDLDWDALTDDYAELIGRARTASEFSDIANRLMGELAASHTGVTNPGPGSSLRQPTGRLGVDFEPIERSDGRPAFRVTHVIPGSPAARASTPLMVGDVITAIDLDAFGPLDTLERRLRGRVGEEVIVSFERRSGNRRIESRALMTPVDYTEFARLKYDDFRAQAERKVHDLSDGRLGYLHIQAMNDASLERFHGDLYAAAHARKGLIIDVRNNGGGHTTDRILTSINAPEHAYTVPAGASLDARGHYPQDRLHAPRYTLPISMLANEKSYSNAEILAHAFNLQGRGTLVGEQTYGGVISTGSHRLIDGATVRRPFRGWYLPDGTDMEHNGALPDLRVAQTPEDEVAGRDRQLRAAVQAMLAQLEQAR